MPDARDMPALPVSTVPSLMLERKPLCAAFVVQPFPCNRRD
jgi:hypothetical protein